MGVFSFVVARLIPANNFYHNAKTSTNDNNSDNINSATPTKDDDEDYRNRCNADPDGDTTMYDLAYLGNKLKQYGKWTGQLRIHYGNFRYHPNDSLISEMIAQACFARLNAGMARH